MFVNKYLEAIAEIRNQVEINTVVDLFGGSGLLSHSAKRHFPNLDVIYNDYDLFTKRLERIDQTNKLLTDIRQLVKGVARQARIDRTTTDTIKQLVRKHEIRYNFVDYITLSSSLLFSGKYVTCYADFIKMGMYHCVKKEDYTVRGYLDGLTITHTDYFDLFVQYCDKPGVLFVVDPPYLSTDSASYKSDKYWKLGDYLKVLKTLQNTNYIFFTSEKSQLVELCNWIANTATLQTFAAQVNHNSTYLDMMLYKTASQSH